MTGKHPIDRKPYHEHNMSSDYCADDYGDEGGDGDPRMGWKVGEIRSGRKVATLRHICGEKPKTHVDLNNNYIIEQI